MNIKISKSELKKTSSNLKIVSDDLKTEASKINAIMTDLENHWVGSDASNFLELMKEQFIPNMNQLANLIDKQGVYLDKVPDVYDVIDNVYGKKDIK